MLETGRLSRVLAVALGFSAMASLACAQDMPPVLAPPTVHQVAAQAPIVPVIPDTPTVVTPAVLAAQPLSNAQIDQLVAPVALYPDALLGQVLMASTYPLEIIEAARWVSIPANRALTGDALTAALKAKNWDPSVMALVAFPRLLQVLCDKLEWTEKLGDAFLAQQIDVMDAVQRLRQAAQVAGNLKATPQCHCTIEATNGVIAIQPAEPQQVYMPVYSPTVVYGVWPDPLYPPFTFPLPAGFAFPPGVVIAFDPVIEVAAFGPLWGWDFIDWRRHHIAIDNARLAFIAARRPGFGGGIWVHDPAHRAGLPYIDPAVTARFGATRVAVITGPRHPTVVTATGPRRFSAFHPNASSPVPRAHIPLVGRVLPPPPAFHHPSFVGHAHPVHFSQAFSDHRR
jgi:hypothetical protein